MTSGESPARAYVVCAGLVAATVIAWWFGTGGWLDPVVSAPAALIIAFGKAWVVGFEYMEIRHSPVWLRAAFSAWAGVFATATVTLAIIAT